MKINFFVMNVLALTSAATDLKSQTNKVMALSQIDTDLASSYPNWDQTNDPLEFAQTVRNLMMVQSGPVAPSVATNEHGCKPHEEWDSGEGTCKDKKTVVAISAPTIVD